ncbi:EAL domain-containing protein [Sporosarcina aquimarina]|uniref:EAL domain-containing protein n=1 Tax=Sporosarcina aquimarina TaxID=114975 RepID=A0ABU4FVR8_9BACL|nr:EAL domain-containing protein [Sporosarcina aquimarina]MDW0108794.1 EAL domain-containing protein [Sporosarcina aquimarina]
MRFFKSKNKNTKNALPKSILASIDKVELGSFILIFNREGEIIEYKGNITENSGVIRLGQKYSDFLTEEEQEKFTIHMQKAISGSVQHFPFKGHQDNIDYEFNVTMFPIAEDSNNVSGLYCILHNIRLAGPEKESYPNQLKDYTYVDSKEITGMLDAHGVVQYITPTITFLLGYEEDECMGKSFKNFVAADRLVPILERWKKLVQVPNSTIQGELKMVDAKGQHRDFELSATNYLTDPAINGIVFSCKDIHELKKRDRRIHYLTNHDHLTGLPNRKVFLDKTELELNVAKLASEKLAVFVLKIQNFKNINSAFGHEFGDRSLLNIATQLHKLFGNDMELLGRSSSNEFVILTKFIPDKQAADVLATSMQEVFNEPFYIEGQELVMNTSLGIAMFPEGGGTAKELYKNASTALHACSEHLRNSHKFYSKTTTTVMKREFVLNNDITTALGKSQFEVYFQPTYHAHTNQISCAEALIRWNHPEYGILSPGEFIKLAEGTGEILPIGEWVMDSACRILSEWHRQQFKIKVAVNVSALQFLDVTLPEVFYEITQRYNLDPKWIEIEITESTLLNTKRIPLLLQQLQEMGFGIVLDDFGTGYNSLKSLQELQPEKIKVDRSFVEKMLVDDRSETITTSIIWMAKMLSVQVVSEGVETVEQRDRLADLECNYFQGYLYSRPVSAKNMTRLLQKQSELEDPREGEPERRNYFRVKPDSHLKAQMTINEVNGKKINVGIVNILVENIGPGGLYFISTVDLPQREDVVLKFSMELFGEEYFFFGKLIHTKSERQYFGYGVSFQADEKTRSTYIHLFNKVEVRLNQPNAYKDLPLLEGRMQTFLEASNSMYE